jgi:manganese/zinc/iron transport system permease protein
MISSTGAGLSTGPTIVLCISAIVAFSLAFAPERGVVPAWVRHQRNRRRLRVNTVLTDLRRLEAQHPDRAHGHTAAVLRAMSSYQGGVALSLRRMQSRGWATENAAHEWSLTPAGLAAAEQVEQANQQAGQPVETAGRTEGNPQ